MTKGIFNPEHELCLANGDPNFVPPESALRFGRDCAKILEILGDDSTPWPPVWGWDSVVRQKLLRNGVPEEELPTVAYLRDVRELSHRRLALKMEASLPRIDALVSLGSREIRSLKELLSYMDCHSEAIIKAPWSGSGKGLFNVRDGKLLDVAYGWCERTIAKQGSLIAQERADVVCDFAMLFCATGEGLRYEGLSLFRNEGNAYKSNLLAGDSYISSKLEGYVGRQLLERTREYVCGFLERELCGRYLGKLGVDMLICRTGGGLYGLAPCVEINLRNTMGLVAHRLYEQQAGQLEEGAFEMRVVYAAGATRLRSVLEGAVQILTELDEDSRYAIAVFPKDTEY